MDMARGTHSFTNTLLVNELTSCSSPDFNPNAVIPIGSHVFEQVHPDTNFISIHNYATLQTTEGGLSQEIAREDTSSLYVTLIFALGVTTALDKRCFIRKSKISVVHLWHFFGLA